MAAFEGFKVRLFRTDASGRTVYVPSRWRDPVYLIRDEAEAERVARYQYKTLWWSMAATLAVFISGAWHSSMLLAFFLVVISGRIAQRRLLATLERLNERASDLPPVDHGARSLAYNVALGRRYFWNQLAAGLLILVMSVAPFFVKNRGADVGPSARLLETSQMFGIAMIVLSAGLIVYSAIQIWRIGKQPPRGEPSMG